MLACSELATLFMLAHSDTTSPRQNATASFPQCHLLGQYRAANPLLRRVLHLFCAFCSCLASFHRSGLHQVHAASHECPSGFCVLVATE
jgi:hypothetical protein